MRLPPNRPNPMRIGDLYACVERGPDKSDPSKWYWRVRQGSSGQRVYVGWTTVEDIREKMLNSQKQVMLEENSVSSPVAVTEQPLHEDEPTQASDPSPPETVPAVPVQADPVRMMMSIGLVSAKEHVKALTIMLKKHGYTCYYMGSYHAVNPAKVDALVCRHRSISHEAFWLCAELARKGTIPVIFENGSTQVLEQLEQIRAGTWVQSQPPQMQERTADVPSDDAELSREEVTRIERENRINSVKSAIGTVIEKGGFFSASMHGMNPEAVRDLLTSIPHSERDRVKRVAVYQGIIALKKEKSTHLSEAVLALIAEGMSETTLWCSDGKSVWSEPLISDQPCRPEQLTMFLKEINRRVTDVSYSQEQPVIPEPAAPDHQTSLPEMLDEVVLDQEQPAAGVFLQEETKVGPPSVMDVGCEPQEVHRDILDAAKILFAEMDKFGVTDLPLGMLREIGLVWRDTNRDLVTGGSLSLTRLTLHAFDMTGKTMCSTPSSRVVANMVDVTCPDCRKNGSFMQALAFQEMLMNDLIKRNMIVAKVN